MSDNTANLNTIINGSIIIAVYFIFWVIVTVVLPIISVGLRLYSKESEIINEKTSNTMQDKWTDVGFLNLVVKDCFSSERSYWSNLPSLSKSLIPNRTQSILLYSLLPPWSKLSL